ncbi:MAG TPA: calcium-binding protein [Geminicoccaceae bacterium]|nr:calcium-binding protein [Geminicoccus sp.]HMU48397.1 calcium-binding protein [Geminicoccaceae bacterium]
MADEATQADGDHHQPSAYNKIRASQFVNLVRRRRGAALMTREIEMALYLGTSGNNSITGSASDDAMLGFGGNDTLYGGTGNDGLAGGSGNDSLYGGTGNDGIDGGIGNDVMDGGTGNDIIDGSDGNDSLYGGIGNDELDGGEGNDYLTSSFGDDDLYGGNGNDELFGGSENDYLSAGNGNDDLYGGAGNDTLYGGSGNDFVDGGTGTDSLSGGTGNDVYDFDSTAEMGLGASRDVITNFGDLLFNEDLIDVSTIDANTSNGAGTNDAFSAAFIAAGASFTAAGQIRISQNPANLTQRIVEFNTDNDAAVEAQILIQVGGGSLTSVDFIL